MAFKRGLAFLKKFKKSLLLTIMPNEAFYHGRIPEDKNGLFVSTYRCLAGCYWEFNAEREGPLSPPERPFVNANPSRWPPCLTSFSRKLAGYKLLFFPTQNKRNMEKVCPTFPKFDMQGGTASGGRKRHGSLLVCTHQIRGDSSRQ